MKDKFHELDLLSRQLNQAHRSAVQRELNAAGLREVGHPMLLTILESGEEDAPCHAQRDLAELLHISPAAVANSLKSLEKSGYIRREPGQRDARRNRVLLTEKGTQAVAGCRASFQRVSDRMMADFSPEECQQLMKFIEKMLQNLLSSPESQKKE